ncbi:MAG: hypothetical protein BM556_13655 [Bacteriovorax sp. MedPE-SWde]|nr:MAG: hypothetical protein BM556_13655 [Bacteriovorax sp. MedPE-SWde]
MKIFKLLPIFMFIISCTKVKTINKKEHSFNSYPEKLIILQVPGLSEEHLAYLRFQKPLMKEATWPENFTCFGKMWRFNLHSTRPKVEDSLLSQITGYSGSEQKCEKYNKNTVWSVLSKFNYQTAIVERGSSEFIENALKCNDKYFKDSATFISTARAKGENIFHHQRSGSYENSKVYYDDSCSKGECFSKSSEVFFHAWNSLTNRPKKLMIYRDHGLLNAIKANDREKFYSSLVDLNKLVGDIQKQIQSKNPDSLVVVTSTSPRHINWPKDSRSWKRLNLAKSSRDGELLSPVWANGAMSENFCGMFSEFEIFERVFWRPKKSRFPLVDALGF